MSFKGEARRKLEAAMAEYGFTDRDRVHWPGHVTDGTDCWCHPDKACGTCRSIEPCVHGSGRPLLLIHRKAS